MGASELTSTIRVLCAQCTGERNHTLLHEYVDELGEFDGWWERYRYQVCKCQGCDSVRFRKVYTDVMGHGPDDEVVWVYPEQKNQRHLVVEPLAKLPVVGQIYSETVAAFNADSLILAGGGLRATVEAICKERGISGETLQAKIDALVSEQLLAKPQADLLHEARYIGNAALHEIERPPESDVAIGLEIVEGLLKTIYVLPSRAAGLRRMRHNDGTGSDEGAEH